MADDGDLFLTADELAALTGKRRPSAQVRVLRTMGLRHYVRPDGRPVVRRAWLDEKAVPRRKEPDYSALDG